LTIAVTFAGSWFFDYTTTDPQTKKKILTVWGRRALTFSVGTLVLSAGLTLFTDLNDILAKKKAEQAAKEAIENSNKQIKLALDSKQVMDKMLAFAEQHWGDFSPQAKTDFKQAVSGSETFVDIAKNYPDLYRRLQSANSYDETVSAINDIQARQVGDRMSPEARCQDIHWIISPNVLSTPNPIKTLGLRFPENRSLVFMVEADGIDFDFSDYNKGVDLHNSYAFKFVDGQISPTVKCYYAGFNGCSAHTRDDTARRVFELLQNKQISGLIYAGRNIQIPEPDARQLQHIASCIKP